MPEHGTTGQDGPSALRSRSLGAIGTLIKRQAAVRAMNFGANVLLARLLVPDVFGVYAIVLFVVQFLSTFGDVGIGAALIQKKEEVTEEELSSVFWLQQALAWSVVLAAWLLAPLAGLLYPSLPPFAAWLVRAMAVSFALASLKTVPAILMERRLDFGRIAAVDIAETAAFYGTAVPLALAGAGVWSFIAAALLRSACGVLMIYSMADWRPSRPFSASAAGGLVRFGLPYQGNTVLSFVKDAVTPLFVGVYCGAQAVGLLNWARTFAFAPLMLSEAFGRVAFPAFSRIQGDRPLLARAVERSMRAMTLLLFPVTALMAALGPELVHALFTDKWRPGLRAFYFYCASPMMAGIALPMYSAILALGRSGIVLKMMLTLLALEWGLGVPLVVIFGFDGIAFSQPLVAGLFFFVYRAVLKVESVPVRTLANIAPQLLAAASAAGAARLAMSLLPGTLAGVSAAAVCGGAVYAAAVRLAAPAALSELRQDLAGLFCRGGAR